MADLQQELEQRIAHVREGLDDLERRRIYTSDPIERERLEKGIEHLQKDLFKDRKRLAALSEEPVPPRTSDPRPHVFISYSRADREWLDRLLVYLRPLEPDAVLDIWDDTRIEAGGRWRDHAEAELAAAKVAVLLVSADYLASDYVIDRELPFLLEAARDRGVLILPVIVSPGRFERTPLREFQAVNSPSSPLSGKSKREQDHILANVAASVHNMVTSSSGSYA